MELILPKKMISLRLEEGLLELLERISKLEDSMFWERDRTWLIEYAVKNTYEELADEDDDNKEEELRSPN